MRYVLAALKLVISIGLLYFAFTQSDFSSIWPRLQGLGIAWAVVTLAILLCQQLLVSIRWREIATSCGAQLPLGSAFRWSLISAFFNQVLPSTVGGDAVRIWLFARDGAGWPKATYSVLLDRFVGVLVLALIVVLCLPWAFQVIQNPFGRMVLVAIGCGSIAAGLGFLALGSRDWKRAQAFWPTRHILRLANTAVGLFKQPLPVAVVMTVSIATHLLTATAAWSLAQAAGIAFGFVNSLLLVLPVMLIAAVPISIAGWGVRESALMVAFGYAGLSQNDGLLLSLLFGASSFLVGVLGGATWFLSGSSVPIARIPEPNLPDESK